MFIIFPLYFHYISIKNAAYVTRVYNLYNLLYTQFDRLLPMIYVLEDRRMDYVIIDIFVILIYKTNKFYIGVRLFSNRSQT